MVISLCHIDDIPEGAARGFSVNKTGIFAVKKRSEIFVYLNRCPHLGIALEWEPDDFLDKEGLYIRCCNHGAYFELESGKCIMGPCLGDSLWALDFTVVDNHIMLAEEALPAPVSPT